MPDHRTVGYDDWLDAIDAGEGYYVECASGHGSLPPRRACPECGSTDLDERPLPTSGQVQTYTTVHVATPRFEDEAPYVTAIADFGAVRLTGMLLGDDADAVAVGLPVEPTVETVESADARVLRLRPA